MTEKQIQNAILREFGTRPDMRLWRQNTGVGFYGKGRTVRYGLPGAADLTGILAGGYRLEIEVKSDTGKQTPEQETYAMIIANQGGLYILARSVADVYRALDAYGWPPSPRGYYHKPPVKDPNQ